MQNYTTYKDTQVPDNEFMNVRSSLQAYFELLPAKYKDWLHTCGVAHCRAGRYSVGFDIKAIHVFKRLVERIAHNYPQNFNSEILRLSTNQEGYAYFQLVVKQIISEVIQLKADVVPPEILAYISAEYPQYGGYAEDNRFRINPHTGESLMDMLIELLLSKMDIITNEYGVLRIDAIRECLSSYPIDEDFMIEVMKEIQKFDKNHINGVGKARDKQRSTAVIQQDLIIQRQMEQICIDNRIDPNTLSKDFILQRLKDIGYDELNQKRFDRIFDGFLTRYIIRNHAQITPQEFAENLRLLKLLLTDMEQMDDVQFKKLFDDIMTFTEVNLLYLKRKQVDLLIAIIETNDKLTSPQKHSLIILLQQDKSHLQESIEECAEA